MIAMDRESEEDLDDSRDPNRAIVLKMMMIYYLLPIEPWAAARTALY
jgi:hypothetical protein